MNKKYWLLKSEPDVWSIEQQKKEGNKGASWDGVRNYQAAKNLKAMKKGDQCFFYHSNIGKEIVGIVEVIKEAYVDKTDQSGRFVAITVKFIIAFPTVLFPDPDSPTNPNISPLFTSLQRFVNIDLIFLFAATPPATTKTFSITLFCFSKSVNAILVFLCNISSTVF